MAKRTGINAIFVLLCCLICFPELGFVQRAEALGIDYGQLGDNLLQPQQVVSLLSSNNITRARIYDTNPKILTAFANSDIELIVTVENDMISQLTNTQAAVQWLTTRIKPYIPSTKITDIMVGNEIDRTDLLASLVPAMTSIQRALSQLGLDSQIKVSSPFSYGVMEESYPPSAGTFKTEVSDVMLQLLQHLSSTKAPFWINAYPYFAYKGNSKEIPLDYVLFNNDGSSAGVTDPSSNLHYDNLLYAQVDAVSYAIKKLGFDDIEVKVAETGWPSKGDDDELGASLENAATYNGNLLKRQLAGEGTPLKPNLDVYIFALFDENMKTGPTSEKNFGLFHPDGTVAYDVGLSGLSSATSSAPNSTPASAPRTPALPAPATRSIKPPSPPTPTPSTSASNSTNVSSPPTPNSDTNSTATRSLSEPPTASPPEIAMTYSGLQPDAKTTKKISWVILIIVVGGICAVIGLYILQRLYCLNLCSKLNPTWAPNSTDVVIIIIKL